MAYADNQQEKLTQQIEELRLVGQELSEARQQRSVADSNLERDFDALGAPKILYRCNGSLAMLASKNALANYNAILYQAKEECLTGQFEIVKSDK
ncbi:hypothetical protein D3C76_1479390 [compost metagenome]